MAEGEIKRADYGYQEVERRIAESTTKIDAGLDDIPGDYNSLLREPINAVLLTHYKSFLRNEQHAADIFSALNKQLEKFQELVDNYPYYEQMEIVSLMKTVLHYYKSWSAALKHSTFMATDVITNLKKVVQNEYVSMKSRDETIEEIKETMKSIDKKGTYGSVIQSNKEKGTILLAMPEFDEKEFSPTTKIKLKKITTY